MNWISYIKENENQALKDIYTSHRGSCLSWLRSQYSISEEDAKEIFQSSIIILYDNVMTGKLKELTVNIKSYLYSIAKNKAREHFRKVGKIVDGENLQLVSSENGVEVKQKLEAKINTVNQALQSIGDPCKSLLQLYYYKRMSMTEIGTLMGYKNSDTVKNQKYKCIKRLQKLLIDHINVEGQYEA